MPCGFDSNFVFGRNWFIKLLPWRGPWEKFINLKLEGTKNYSNLYKYVLSWASPESKLYRICLQCRRYEFDHWGGKIPWRRTWQPTLIFLPGEFHGQRTFWATAHGVTKTGIALKCPSMHARRVQCILFLSNALIIVETYHPLVPFALYFLNVFNDITSIVRF